MAGAPPFPAMVAEPLPRLNARFPWDHSVQISMPGHLNSAGIENLDMTEAGIAKGALHSLRLPTFHLAPWETENGVKTSALSTTSSDR